jgi:hypothetical protein
MGRQGYGVVDELCCVPVSAPPSWSAVAAAVLLHIQLSSLSRISISRTLGPGTTDTWINRVREDGGTCGPVQRTQSPHDRYAKLRANTSQCQINICTNLLLLDVICVILCIIVQSLASESHRRLVVYQSLYLHPANYLIVFLLEHINKKESID